MSPNDAPVGKLSRERARRKNKSGPRTLGTFHDAKVLAIVRCPTCHCDHYGISAEDAAASVAATNALLATLNAAEAIELYGARTVSTTRFTRCFFCSTPASSMAILSKDEPYSEPSPLPIIVELLDVRKQGRRRVSTAIEN